MKGAFSFLLSMTAGVVLAHADSVGPAVNVGNLPLWFEPANDPSTEHSFTAHGRNSQFTISPAGVEFALQKEDGRQSHVRMTLVGANPAAILHGANEMTGKVTYLFGSQPSQWRTGVDTFGQVKADQVLPGVDVVYYGNQRQLEYDFNVAAGVNPKSIQLRFDGVEQLTINARGELVVAVAGGVVYQHRPEAYQMVNGVRHEITVGYTIGAGHSVLFDVGDFDHGLPLVIDPVLGYSTYFGGNGYSLATALAIDSTGAVYFGGNTLGNAFSNAVPNGVFKTFKGGTINGDGFIAKFDSTGTNLLFLTYLGGSADDGVTALAIDSQGNLIVAGYTDSTDFPTAGNIAGLTNHIHGTVIPRSNGVYPSDVFLAKLGSNGTNLIYSGYFGGDHTDGANAMAIDPVTGNIILAGYTYSTNFPCTKLTAFQPQLNSLNSLFYNYNSFISVISISQSNLLYSTFYGGTNQDVIRGIAFTNGNLFVAGVTASTNVYGFNSPSQTFVYTNYLGTNQLVMTNVVTPAILNGPVVTNNFTPYDAFVAAFRIPSSVNPSDFAQVTNLYSMYLGGDNNDYAYAIAADGNNNAYVVGTTMSTNFPYVVPNMAAVTNLSFLATNGIYLGPATNAFLTQVAWNGTNATIAYSVEFGGLGIDSAFGVALDSRNNIWITGSTTSTNIPHTAGLGGVLSGTNYGGNDAFLVSFNPSSALPQYGAYIGGYSDDFGYALAIDATNDIYILGQTISPNFPTNNAWYGHYTGVNDLFLAKILPMTNWPTPFLRLSRFSTNDYMLSWPPLPAGGSAALHLEENTNLAAGNWLTLTNITLLTNTVTITNFSLPVNTNASPNVVTFTNGNSLFGFTTTNPAQFFRLHQY